MGLNPQDAPSSGAGPAYLLDGGQRLKKFLFEGKFLLRSAARVPGTQHWGVIHAMG